MTALVCGWCGGPVHVPQRGWEAGRDAYCPECVIVEGRHPWVIAQRAIDRAEALQNTHTADLIRWPFQAVHDMCGLLVPGRLTYVAAFPSNGKTSFLVQCLYMWLNQGIRVTYLPLESDPGEIYTRLVCHQGGINADEALSMRLRERAEQGDPIARDHLLTLTDGYKILRGNTDRLHQLRIEPIDTLTPHSFEKACQAADVMDSDLIVVDHIDHCESDAGDASPEIVASNRLQQQALRAAKRLRVPIILATQLNSSRTGGDRLAHYRPPLTDWLYNKGKKEQVAANIIGLYRPMDPDATPDQVSAVRGGRAEPPTVAQPNRMGIAGMKLRYGGAMKERTALLQYEGGVLSDVDPLDRRDDARAEVRRDLPRWLNGEAS